MRASYIIIVCLLLLVSCKTKHKASRSEQSSVHIESVSSSRSTLQQEQQSIASVIEQLLESIDISEQITYLSAPDSAGKQYPTAIHDRKTNKRADLQRKSEFTASEQLISIDSTSIELKSDSTATIEQKTMSEQDSRPSWLVYIAIIAIALILVYIVARKYILTP